MWILLIRSDVIHDRSGPPACVSRNRPNRLIADVCMRLANIMCDAFKRRRTLHTYFKEEEKEEKSSVI